MKVDFHVHCNQADSENVKLLIRTCEDNETIVCMSGGERYGGHDYVPNEEVLNLSREYSDWIVPFARFDLWDQPSSQIVYTLAGQGYKGLKFIYPYHPYDHDLYMPVYEAARDAGLPVLFHTGLFRPSVADAKYHRPVLKNMNPLNLDRIARSFPELKIVMAHMGTTLWRHEAAELVKLHPNLYTDLAGSGSWMQMSAQELTERLGSVHREIDTEFTGFRKLILGSDAYTTHPHIIPEAQHWYSLNLKKVGVPDDVVKDIMGGTVSKWLGLKI